MKKRVFDSVKYIGVILIFVMFASVNQCFADVIPIDHENYQSSQALQNKQNDLSNSISTSVKQFEKRKNLKNEEKKQYKTTFRDLLTKCQSLKEEIKSQISYTKKKEIEETKSWEEATKQFVAKQKLNPPKKDEEYSYHRAAPRKKDYSGDLNTLNESKQAIMNNEKQLMNILKTLGEKNINTKQPDTQNKSMELRNHSLISFIGLSLVSLVLSMFFLIKIKSRYNLQ